MATDTVSTDERDEREGSRDAKLKRVRRFAARFRKSKLAMIGAGVLSTFVFLGLFGPHLTPHDPAVMNTGNALASPSLQHPFGTDNFGRDILSRVLAGTRIALTVAVFVPIVSMSIGVPVGLVSGYFGGWIDNGLMRVMDSLFAFPAILLGLTLVAVFGQGLRNIIFAIGIVFIPQFARITRGSAASAAKEEHVKAARSMGASHTRILLYHILPFCVSAIMVQASITAAIAILVEASLSFLGVGIPAPAPSWGAMLQVAKGYVESAWWFGFFPGLAIIFAVLGFNLLGDGLRDVLDPRMGPNR